MKYQTKHVILTENKQHALGAEVTERDFRDKDEVDRLLRLGAIEPLKGTEGYTGRPEPRPDQGDDPTPRGQVSSDWFASAVTVEEIDAHIAALQLQREAAANADERRKAAQAENDKLAVDTARRGPGRPVKVDQQAV